MVRIEIIAIGEDKVYSVGYVHMTNQKDIYVIYKLKDWEMHFTRHKDGKTHWKINDEYQNFPDRKPINELDGIEFMPTHGFGLKSLPAIFTETKLRKCNGIFAIDMRQYSEGAFNLNVAILTEEGLPKFFSSHKKISAKRQLYLYADSKPMIGFLAIEVKK